MRAISLFKTALVVTTLCGANMSVAGPVWPSVATMIVRGGGFTGETGMAIGTPLIYDRNDIYAEAHAKGFGVPSVFVTARIDDSTHSGGYGLARVEASIRYGFHIKAPEGAEIGDGIEVPITLLGEYSMQTWGHYSTSMVGSHVFQSENREAPSQHFIKMDNSYSTALVSGRYDHRYRHMVYSDKTNWAAVQLDALVNLTSDRSLGIKGYGYAYIDPYVSIDPDWLKMNPGYSIVMSEGIGNDPIDPVAVSEGNIFGMLLIGTLALGVARRRYH